MWDRSQGTVIEGTATQIHIDLRVIEENLSSGLPCMPWHRSQDFKTNIFFFQLGSQRSLLFARVQTGFP